MNVVRSYTMCRVSYCIAVHRLRRSVPAVVSVHQIFIRGRPCDLQLQART